MAKQRGRTKHPGVVLIKPDPAREIGWRARYVDPDTGVDRITGKTIKRTKVSLGPSIRTEAQRIAWAVNKSRELAKRHVELAGGATPASGVTLSHAVDRYFDAHPQLRDRTIADYRAAADKLLAWAKRERIESDSLTRPLLMSFREELIREPKKVAAKGKGTRGKPAATGERRSAVRVNNELRKVRTVLGYLADVDMFPRITRDDLRRALKRLPVTTERIEFLRQPDCKQLLEACLLHDAETFVETRDEHAGEGRSRIGTTQRYESIAPLVAFILLTGCRFGEAIALDWRQVDLDALDGSGQKAGEIHLSGAATKTHKARTIGLDVSPALRTMLAAMRPQTGRGSVFGVPRAMAEAAAKRLKAEYGAPPAFTYLVLRRTCGTFLTNAPSIFHGASAYRSAKQLGHAVQVAERHYTGLVRYISPDARSLEAAMEIEDVMLRIIADVPAKNTQTAAAEDPFRRPRQRRQALGGRGQVDDREAGYADQCRDQRRPGDRPETSEEGVGPLQWRP
ncbi:MAG: hypothetical protein JWN04_3853 [Myxococcaceae bacterium]|nr:hypothetical protein [Myxococcaceae bacterium]